MDSCFRNTKLVIFKIHPGNWEIFLSISKIHIQNPSDMLLQITVQRTENSQVEEDFLSLTCWIRVAKCRQLQTLRIHSLPVYSSKQRERAGRNKQQKKLDPYLETIYRCGVAFFFFFQINCFFYYFLKSLNKPWPVPVQFCSSEQKPWFWQITQLTLEMGLDCTRAERITVFPSSWWLSLGTCLEWVSVGDEVVFTRRQYWRCMWKGSCALVLFLEAVIPLLAFPAHHLLWHFSYPNLCSLPWNLKFKPMRLRT